MRWIYRMAFVLFYERLISRPECGRNKKVQEYREVLVASGLYPYEERKMGRIIQMPISPVRASAGTGNYIDEADFE